MGMQARQVPLDLLDRRGRPGQPARQELAPLALPARKDRKEILVRRGRKGSPVRRGSARPDQQESPVKPAQLVRREIPGKQDRLGRLD